MISNNSNINVETKTNTLNKIITTYSICSEFILGYRYKMPKIYLKIKPGKKIQTLLVILNVVLQTARDNKIHC